MAAMTLKDKENMVKVIRGFYGNAVASTPEQISEEVVGILDKMVKEIASCTRKVKFLVDTYEFLYTGSPMKTLFTRLPTKFAKTSIDNIISNWTKDAKKQFATRACVNATLVKWRSPLQRALAGNIDT